MVHTGTLYTGTDFNIIFLLDLWVKPTHLSTLYLLVYTLRSDRQVKMHPGSLR